jgi:hypothetical protein
MALTGGAELAGEVSAARARLIEFVRRCPAEQWESSPVPGDPRTVAVIVDHVADAYEYLGSWVRGLARGEPAEVTPDVVDELNARHAGAAGAPTQEAAIEHLQRSGDAFVELIESLGIVQLSTGEGRIARFAEIAARHADSHRVDLEAVLPLSG